MDELLTVSVLSALMIPPPPSRYPRIRETLTPVAPTLRAIPRRSRGSPIAPSTEAQGEQFPFTVHAERDHERLSAAVPFRPSRSAESSRLRSWNFQLLRRRLDQRRGHRARRHTAKLCLPPSPSLRTCEDIRRSTSDRSSSEAGARVRLLGTFSAGPHPPSPQSRVLDRELLATDVPSTHVLTRSGEARTTRMVAPGPISLRAPCP